jgi:hypothetical protein
MNHLKTPARNMPDARFRELRLLHAFEALTKSAVRS